MHREELLRVRERPRELHAAAVAGAAEVAGVRVGGVLADAEHDETRRGGHERDGSEQQAGRERGDESAGHRALHGGSCERGETFVRGLYFIRRTCCPRNNSSRATGAPSTTTSENAAGRPSAPS